MIFLDPISIGDVVACVAIQLYISQNSAALPISMLDYVILKSVTVLVNSASFELCAFFLAFSLFSPYYCFQKIQKNGHSGNN